MNNLKCHFVQLIPAAVGLHFRFLGSSGQPINDIYKYSKMEDRLDMLEKTLVWGHMAPTAPDTLGIEIHRKYLRKRMLITFFLKICLFQPLRQMS